MPHVAGVNAVVRRGDLCQLDDLVRLRENPGQINQAGRKADRAILHGLVHEGFHFVEFLRRRRPIECAAHGFFAHVIVSHQRGHIHGDIRLLDFAKQLCHVQCGTPAIAHHHRRHSHADEVLRARHVGQFIGMRMNIDEARRHD